MNPVDSSDLQTYYYLSEEGKQNVKKFLSSFEGRRKLSMSEEFLYAAISGGFYEEYPTLLKKVHISDPNKYVEYCIKQDKPNTAMYISHLHKLFVRKDNLISHIYETEDEAIENIVHSHEQITNFLIKDVKDEMKLLEYGIVPHALYDKVEGVDVWKLISFIKQGYTKDELDFCVGENVLKEIKIWSYFTKEYAENFCKLGLSGPLLYTFPDLIWDSGRPKTGMEMFRTVSSKTMSELENYTNVPGENIIKFSNGQSAIRVSRY